MKFIKNKEREDFMLLFFNEKLKVNMKMYWNLCKIKDFNIWGVKNFTFWKTFLNPLETFTKQTSSVFER